MKISATFLVSILGVTAAFVPKRSVDFSRAIPQNGSSMSMSGELVNE